MSYQYFANHIPSKDKYNRRPLLMMEATTITIHNTGNAKSTAQNERDWLTNPSNQRQASFHIVVDEHEAIECVPLNEVAWHAGDGNGNGNRHSIGIEICESGNYAQTLINASELVAHMLFERGWGIDRLRRHFDWSGKICPRLMYSGGKWTAWERFKLMVSKQLKSLKDGEGMTTAEKEAFEKLQKTVEAQAKRIEELEAKAILKEIPSWALEACKAAKSKEINGQSIVDTTAGGSMDFYRNITVLHRLGMFN